MSDLSFHDGGEYVRDYILANLGLRMEGVVHDIHKGYNSPEYRAYQDIYNFITNKFGDIFTDLKG